MKSANHNLRKNKGIFRSQRMGKTKANSGPLPTASTPRLLRETSEIVHPVDVLATQPRLGNQAVQRLLSERNVAATTMPDIQRDASADTSSTQNQAAPPSTTTWIGEISGTWSAALRKTASKDPNNPHANTLADLPAGTSVLVKGEEKGWLRVEVTLKGKTLTGYVSHELVKFRAYQDLVFNQADLDKVLEQLDADRITIEKAFVILKRAEMAKANDPGFKPDAKLAKQLETIFWMFQGSDKWLINPDTYQVTLKQKPNEKIKIREMEDFILFVEAVERQYPGATPKEIASEIRQIWFSDANWEVLVASQGIKDSPGGKARDIETQGPIPALFDMKDLAPAQGEKVISTPFGPVTVSHVMAGIDAALSGAPPQYPESFLEERGHDDDESKLKYKTLMEASGKNVRDFTTWSGDLGQAYAEYLVERWVEKYSGSKLQSFMETKASEEQLRADIHGYIAVKVWQKVPAEKSPTGSIAKVSNFLRDFYLVSKKEAGLEQGYRAYFEEVAQKRGPELRAFIVERSLAFARPWYAKEAVKHWGMGKSAWEWITSSNEEILENQMDDFDKQHQKNESEANEENKLGGYVDKFLEMLDQKMH